MVNQKDRCSKCEHWDKKKLLCTCPRRLLCSRCGYQLCNWCSANIYQCKTVEFCNLKEGKVCMKCINKEFGRNK